jgi:hypothetical protein
LVTVNQSQRQENSKLSTSPSKRWNERQERPSVACVEALFTNK